MDRKRVVSSVSWQMLNKVCSFGMNFIIQIILARMIIPEDFGNLAILNAVIGMANIFVESGVSVALIRKKDLDGADIFTTQVISMFTALFFCVVLVAFSIPIANYYQYPDLAKPLCMISIVLIFNSLNSVFSSLLTREMEFKKLFVRTVLVLPVSGFVGSFLAYKGYGIWALVIYQICTSGLNSIVFVAYLKNRLVPKFSLKKAKEIYSFGIKILLSGIVNGIYDSIRTLIIGGKYSKGELAYYDRAYTYSRYSVQIVNTTITSVALPLFSKQQDTLVELKNSARRIVGFSAFVMFPVLVGLASISRPFIMLLLTEKWEPCIPFFIIFCFLRMPGVITEIDMQMFYSIGRSDIALKYSVLSLLLNICTLYFVFPYGVIAISINMLVIEIITSIVIMITSSYVTGYSVKEKINDLFRPILNSLLMLLFEWALIRFISFPNLLVQLVVQIITGFFLYFLFSHLLHDTNIGLIKRILVSVVKKGE